MLQSHLIYCSNKMWPAISIRVVLVTCLVAPSVMWQPLLLPPGDCKTINAGRWWLVWATLNEMFSVVKCWFTRESHMKFSLLCRSPLPESTKSSNLQGYPYLSKPNFFQLDLETPSWNSGGTGGASATYISVAPPEVRGSLRWWGM